MKVKFSKQYKSIEFLPDINLPDFTILTGVNGAGKTHLLEGMSSGHIQLEIGNRRVGSMVYFNYQDFIVKQAQLQQATQQPNQGSPMQKIRKFQDQSVINGELKIVQDKMRPLFVGPYAENENTREESSVYQFIFQKMLRMNIDGSDERPIFEEIMKAIATTSTNRGNNLALTGIKAIYLEVIGAINNIEKNSNDDELVKKYYLFSKGAKVSLMNLTSEQVLHKEDVLGQELMDEFTAYRVTQTQNDLQKIRSDRGENAHYLDEDQFKMHYGVPPWDTLNQVLKKYSCNGYSIPVNQIPHPSFRGGIENFRPPLRLVNQSTNQHIGPEDLSSGEKTLLALALTVYRQRKGKLFSDVLLLDEIDGSLHPSMIQQLLDVLENVFVREYGMKILLVTHSPTTIALAPDSSIFIMHRDGENTERIQKKDKGIALKILTEGYATLDEGIRLFDQISRKEISILTEGRNAQYLEKANEFFGDLNRIEVITEAEGISGEKQLRTLYDFFFRVNHKNKVFFVWDCDAIKQRGLSKSNNTIPYVFLKNDENKTVETGIENLFSQELVRKFYADEEMHKSGSKFTRMDKNKLREHLISHGSKNDFSKFKPLFELIKEN